MDLYPLLTLTLVLMKQVYLICFIVFTSCFLFGQQEVSYSFYRHHFNIINPAIAGTTGLPEFTMSVRSQWNGIEGAPHTRALSFSFPHSNQKMGLGASIINDQFNVERQTYMALDFSYLLAFEKSQLYLGLKAGGNAYNLRAASSVVYGPDGLSQDIGLENLSRFLPNLGIGIYFTIQKSFISLSIPRLLDTQRFKDDIGQRSTATDRPHLFLSAGHRFPLYKAWEATPSFIVSAVEGAPIQTLLDTTLSFRQQFDIGLQYTFSSSFGFNTQFKLGKQTHIGYAYTAASRQSLRPLPEGVHELLLKIKLNAKTITADDPTVEASNHTQN